MLPGKRGGELCGKKNVVISFEVVLIFQFGEAEIKSVIDHFMI